MASITITIIFLFLISSSAAAAVDDLNNNNNNSIEVASTDYGNIIRNPPSSVLQPSSVEDIIKLILNSSSSSFPKVAARGHGHSLRGQAMALNGVVVNMTAFKNAVEIRNDSFPYYADVAGGQLWIDVLRATLEQGLAPVSWTDYLYLTVGGTLSNAGISGQAFKRGPQIAKANVLQLDVVTGKGESMSCSPNKNPELFNGVLGGLGQFGIITKARILLETAPTRVLWARLIYSNFSSFTQDQEYLINDKNGLISYVEGFLILNATTVTSQWAPLFPISNSQQSQIAALLNNTPQNQSILYSIELALYYNTQTAQTVETEFQTLHKDLKFVRGLNFSKDAAFFDFINRVPNLDTPEMGSKLAHPWLNLFVPKSRILDFNRLVLVGLLPNRLRQTTGLIIFYPLNKKRWDYNMSAVTPDDNEDVFYTLGLLHSAETDNYKTFDDFNNHVLRACEKEGIEVKQYLAGYKTRGQWMKHFGPKWTIFSKRKQMFDPKYLLSPGQAIFNS